MILRLILSILMMLVGLQVKAEDAVAGDPGIVNQNSSRALQAVIEADPVVQRVVKACYEDDKDEEGNHRGISRCLWEDLGPDQARVKQLIEQAQAAEIAQADGTSSGTMKLRSTVTGVGIRSFSEDSDNDIQKQALKKLADFYEKRLDEALKPSDDNLNVTDQNVFFELAKTQIGKNVIAAWSAVCMDSGWVGNKLVIFTNAQSTIYKEIRKKNIASLTTTAGSDGKTGGQVLSGMFFNCVAALPMLCKKARGSMNASSAGAQNQEQSSIQAEAADSDSKIDYRNYSIAKDKVIQTMSGSGSGLKTPDNDNTAAAITQKSQDRACETIAYVDGLRRQLAATEKVSEALANDETTKTSQISLLDKKERRTGDVDIDRLTTITSGDVTDEDSYYGSLESNIQLVEQCKETPDDPRCAGLVANTDAEKDKLHNSGVAFMIETEVIKEKLKDKTTIAQLSLEEKENLLRRLDPNTPVDEGDIDQKLENLGKYFQRERDSLISSLSNKIKELEVSSTENPADEIRKVGDKLLSRGNEYVQLMHFNNIISGYFNVEGGKTNVRVLDLELERVANLEGNTGLSQGYQANSSLFGSNYRTRLEEDIQDNNVGVELGSSSEQNEIINLRSDQIGQFLDYTIDETP